MIIRYKNKISTRKKKEKNTCDLWGTVSLQLVAASLAAAVAHARDRWRIGEGEGHRHADRKLLPAGRPGVIDARHGRDTRQKPAGSPDRRWRRRRLARPQAQCTHSQRYDGVPINGETIDMIHPRHVLFAINIIVSLSIAIYRKFSNWTQLLLTGRWLRMATSKLLPLSPIFVWYLHRIIAWITWF